MKNGFTQGNSETDSSESRPATQAGELGREASTSDVGSSSAAAGAARAPEYTPAAEFQKLPLVKTINERLARAQTPTLSYQGNEVAVMELRRDGIRGRDETGADLVLPYEGSHMWELFKALGDEPIVI